MPRTAIFGSAFAFILSLAPVAAQRIESDSVANFFRNKTLRLIVSAGTGGGYDVYGRTLAAFLGRHIPGAPNVIVENMTGAGGLSASTYLADAAPKDGSVIALLQSTALLAPYLGNKAAKFDPVAFTAIGNMSKEYSLCVSWHTSLVKTADDLFRKEFLVGSSGAGSAMDTYPNVLKTVLGMRIKVIAGYSGGSAVLLAMERGEVQGRCGASLETYRALRPEWLRKGQINLLLQTSLEKDPELPDVPWILDSAKTEEQRAVLQLVLAPRLIQRPIVAPPGVPAERAAALRAAFIATLRDPDFIELAKQRKIELGPMQAAEMTAFIQRLASTPENIRQMASKAMTAH